MSEGEYEFEAPQFYEFREEDAQHISNASHMGFGHGSKFFASDTDSFAQNRSDWSLTENTVPISEVFAAQSPRIAFPETSSFMDVSRDATFTIFDPSRTPTHNTDCEDFFIVPPTPVNEAVLADIPESDASGHESEQECVSTPIKGRRSSSFKRLSGNHNIEPNNLLQSFEELSLSKTEKESTDSNIQRVDESPLTSTSVARKSLGISSHTYLNESNSGGKSIVRRGYSQQHLRKSSGFCFYAPAFLYSDGLDILGGDVEPETDELRADDLFNSGHIPYDEKEVGPNTRKAPTSTAGNSNHEPKCNTIEKTEDHELGPNTPPQSPTAERNEYNFESLCHTPSNKERRKWIQTPPHRPDTLHQFNMFEADSDIPETISVVSHLSNATDISDLSTFTKALEAAPQNKVIKSQKSVVYQSKLRPVSRTVKLSPTKTALRSSYRFESEPIDSANPRLSTISSTSSLGSGFVPIAVKVEKYQKNIRKFKMKPREKSQGKENDTGHNVVEMSVSLISIIRKTITEVQQEVEPKKSSRIASLCRPTQSYEAKKTSKKPSTKQK